MDINRKKRIKDGQQSKSEIDNQVKEMWSRKELADLAGETYTKNIRWIKENGSYKPFFYSQVDNGDYYYILPYFTVDISVYIQERKIVLNRELSIKN